MQNKYIKVVFIILIIISSGNNAYSQNLGEKISHADYLKHFKQSSSSSFLPVSIAAAGIFYLINPILLYENKKLYAGITKEFSIGFGDIGEHRIATEYSLILGGNVKHYLRFSYKYDFLLKDNIKPSHMLQGTGVLSLGAGYFTDFNGNGIFPEVTYGYSIRNHKLLFYPHVKIRYTYMFGKDKIDKADISFGIIFGIANPFIDVNIRRDN
jgi:hypothetical protein